MSDPNTPQQNFVTSELAAASSALTNTITSATDALSNAVNLNTVSVSGKASSFKIHIDGPDGQVMFQASSPLSESRSASYDQYGIVHLPTAMWAYRNTGGRRFQIQGKLVSRTADEAQANAMYLNLIRKWIQPDFGNTGATPPIVKLTAYNNDNIYKLQCIISSYSFTFPDDVDYIFTSSPPMPVIASLSIDLDEVYSAEQITAGLWAINNDTTGTFGLGNTSDSSLLGGSSLFSSIAPLAALGGTFQGIASQASIAAGNFGSTIGQIAGAIAGKDLTGTIAGGIAGSVLGGKIGGALGTSLAGGSSILKDVSSTVNSGLSNVFVSGVTPATIASQASQSIPNLIGAAGLTSLDSFSRSTNPAPPDLADFFG